MMEDFLKGIALMIFGSWVSIQVAIGVLKSKVGKLEDDIDNIGLILGTKRALGRTKQRKEEI